MKIAARILKLGTCCLALGAIAAEATDWPEFRGPTRDGVVPAAEVASLPTEWGEAKNVAWKTAIHGAGLSTPAIADRLIRVCLLHY